MLLFYLSVMSILSFVRCNNTHPIAEGNPDASSGPVFGSNQGFNDTFTCMNGTFITTITAVLDDAVHGIRVDCSTGSYDARKAKLNFAYYSRNYENYDGFPWGSSAIKSSHD